jgi:Domain of unknown function (DUF6815)
MRAAMRMIVDTPSVSMLGGCRCRSHLTNGNERSPESEGDTGWVSTAGRNVRVGILWRSEWDPVDPAGPIDGCRLHSMFDAFEDLGVAAVPVIYSDDNASAVREQLRRLDGLLVWVNPIEQGLDRSKLDPLLREVAEAGVWVSAHPDVILRMATKQVLVDTAAMSWSAETHLYSTRDQLLLELPDRLARGPLVLKQQRGMGGTGVWKVEADSLPLVRVQQAAKNSSSEVMPLGFFVARCEPYFADGGSMVEQPFLPRLSEGMIRVYLSHDRVVGFAHQYPRGLLGPEEALRLPTEKVFSLPSASEYQALRHRMESQWVPELQRVVDVNTQSLPVIWDADFLFGPKSASGDDTFVLCEINASSTFSFPEHAMPTVAEAALDRLGESIA